MLLTNLKIFWKFLGRNKVYTAVTVAGFVVSLMFVIVLGLYVRQELSMDKFHENRDRIYIVASDLEEGRWSSFDNTLGAWLTDTYPDIESYTRAMTTNGGVEMPDGEVIEADGMMADSTFFNIFSFPLLEGDPSQVLARRGVIALSRSFATKVFGADDPMGRSIRMDGREYEVTGIFADLPHNTIFSAVDFMVNYAMLADYWNTPDILEQRGNSSFPLFVLEREGGDVRALGEMIVEDLKPRSFIYEMGFATKMEFIPLEEVYFGGVTVHVLDLKTNAASRVILYLGIALLILIVALLNYINMTVAQAGFRAREVALKKLHGAGRGSIVVQLLVESLVVTLISFGGGLLLAFGLEEFFDGVLDTRLALSAQFTLPVVATIAGLVLLLAFVSGIVPAIMMSRYKPIEIIKGSFSRRVKGVYSRVLAVFQYTVSIALLICSAVIVLQSRYLANLDVGLARDGVLLMQNMEHNSDRKTAMKGMLSDIPGVEAVSLVSENPFDANMRNNAFQFKGQPVSMEMLEADSVFFRLFEIEVEPTGADLAAVPSQDAAYLNRAAYNQFEAAETDDYIDLDGNGRFMVAGIVDFKFGPLYEPQGLLHIQIKGDDMAANVIAVRISKNSDVLAVAERVKSAYTGFIGHDRYRVEWADDTVRAFYESEQRTSRIMGGFTVLVMLIMLMGIFAMSIYVLRQKEKEIAIRKVNGSTIGEVLALLSRQSLVNVALASAVAFPVAWYAMSRWLQRFPYKIGLDLWIFVAAGAAVLLLSLVCVGWQSWRAATANPVKTLKSE